MVVETTARYATSIEGEGGGPVVRIAIYARLSRDPSGLNVNTSIQVAECLKEVRRYVQDRLLRVKIVVIFEENDISASKYAKKERPDFQSLIELVRRNEVNVIVATELLSTGIFVSLSSTTLSRSKWLTCSGMTNLAITS